MTRVPAPSFGLGCPPLVRLLASLTDTVICAPHQSVAERLVQWLGWADAVALSAALGAAPGVGPAGSTSENGAGQAAYARVRASLREAIEAVNVVSAARPGGWPGGRAAAVRPEPRDYPGYRKRYVALQQKMETHIAELRTRLRAMMATRTPALARLARVDVALERALAPQEQALLLRVPVLLEHHFNRLQRVGESEGLAVTVPPSAPRQASHAWLDVFRKDMESVLLAELDFRLQPIEGLLAALRASESGNL